MEMFWWIVSTTTTCLFVLAGFLCLALVFEYVKNYPKERKENKRLLRDLLEFKTPTQVFSGGISLRRHNVSPGLSKAATIFAAYKRSPGFLSCTATPQTTQRPPSSYYTFPSLNFIPHIWSMAFQSSEGRSTGTGGVVPSTSRDVIKNDSSRKDDLERSPRKSGRPSSSTNRCSVDLKDDVDDTIVQNKPLRGALSYDATVNLKSGFHLEQWNKIVKEYPFIIPFLRPSFIQEVNKDIACQHLQQGEASSARKIPPEGVQENSVPTKNQQSATDPSTKSSKAQTNKCHHLSPPKDLSKRPQRGRTRSSSSPKDLSKRPQRRRTRSSSSPKDLSKRPQRRRTRSSFSPKDLSKRPQRGRTRSSSSSHDFSKSPQRGRSRSFDNHADGLEINDWLNNVRDKCDGKPPSFQKRKILRRKHQHKRQSSAKSKVKQNNDKDRGLESSKTSVNSSKVTTGGDSKANSIRFETASMLLKDPLLPVENVSLDDILQIQKQLLAKNSLRKTKMTLSRKKESETEEMKEKTKEVNKSVSQREQMFNQSTDSAGKNNVDGQQHIFRNTSHEDGESKVESTELEKTALTSSQRKTKMTQSRKNENETEEINENTQEVNPISNLPKAETTPCTQPGTTSTTQKTEADKGEALSSTSGRPIVFSEEQAIPVNDSPPDRKKKNSKNCEDDTTKKTKKGKRLTKPKVTKGGSPISRKADGVGAGDLKGQTKTTCRTHPDGVSKHTHHGPMPKGKKCVGSPPRKGKSRETSPKFVKSEKNDASMDRVKRPGKTKRKSIVEKNGNTIVEQNRNTVADRNRNTVVEQNRDTIVEPNRNTIVEPNRSTRLKNPNSSGKIQTAFVKRRSKAINDSEVVSRNSTNPECTASLDDSALKNDVPPNPQSANHQLVLRKSALDAVVRQLQNSNGRHPPPLSPIFL